MMAPGQGVLEDSSSHDYVVVDPDGGPTLLLAEAPLSDEKEEPALPPQDKEAPLFALISLNSRTAGTVEICEGDLQGGEHTTICCGRGGANEIWLQDPRVSVKHFSIVAALHLEQEHSASTTGPRRRKHLSLALRDESSNGTWLNDELVGRDCQVSLANGDRIFVLPSVRVGQQDIIGYVVAMDPQFSDSAEAVDEKDDAAVSPPAALPTVLQAPAEPSPVLQAPAAPSPEEIAKAQEAERKAEQLTESLRCRLCLEAPVHRCATAAPCGHNFDLACLLAWRLTSRDCPCCEEPIRQVVRNRAVDGLAETFIASRPEAAREPATVKLLDTAESDPRAEQILTRLLTGVPMPTNDFNKSKKAFRRPADLVAAAEGLGLPRHLAHLVPFVPSASAENSGERQSTACAIC
eukprot:TRINITY_DN27850_c0_g1_i1.p1 TRINITY_DN27850_c0_g1~~TRINITY_DN27850_c0_g1_i1.p1  ORF type:complete len:407 (+),score=103.29 TRINITY_DN27850_c0_g1_i1:91-1311(+)